jgi:Tfp pilus assembly protein PilO
MIDFRNTETRAASTLIVLSMAILALTLAFMLFAPAPNPDAAVKARHKSLVSIKAETGKLKRRSAEIELQIRPLLWKGAQNEVTAALLDSVTLEANERHLKLSAFRPRKAQDLGAVTELPFSFSVSGPYPIVMSMIRLLDRPAGRVAMRSVEMAATESDSSMVTATIEVSAYLASRAAPAKGKSNEG